MARRIRSILAWVMVLSLTVGSGTLTAMAQDGTPAASQSNAKQAFVADGVDAPILAEAPVADVSSIEGTVVLERLDLPAGSALAQRTSTSAELYYVQAGTLSIQDNFGFGTTVPTGSALALNAGTTFAVANQGSEPATVLRLRIENAASAGATPVASTAGTTQQADEIAPTVLVQMPVRGLSLESGTLFLSRAVFSSGASSGEQGHAGPIGLYVETGSLNVVSPSGFEGTIGTGQAVSLPVETPLRASAASGEATVLIVGIAAAAGPFAEVTQAPEPTAAPEGAGEAASTSAAETNQAQPGEAILFQAGDGTPFGSWASASGWSPLDEMLVSNGQQCSYLVAPVDLGGVRDYAIEAEIQIVSLPKYNSSFGLFGRWNGELRYISGIYSGQDYDKIEKGSAFISVAAEKYKPGDSDFYNYARVPMSGTNIGIDTAWHTYRFVLKGNELRLYLDGAEVSRTTDNRVVQGGDAGLYCDRGTQISVRSFKVISLDGSAGSGQAAPAEAAAVADSGDATSSSVDVMALLPPQGDVPAQLVLAGDRNRSLDDVAANYQNPAETTSLFTGWGWQGNVTRSYLMPDGVYPEPTQVNGVYTSIHLFGSPDSAVAALDYSLADQSASTGAWEVDPPGLGDYSRALFGQETYGNEITLLVQRGNLVIRLSAAQLEGDPTPTAVEIMRGILARM